ncbi:MAG: OmpA family protein [Bacteroidia bacterium]|nr:OmpA family protein [Bacteroidia bacterium]
MKKIILLFTALLFVSAVRSQTEERKWNVGLHGGLVQYNGDRGTSFYKTDQAAYAFAGISVSRYLGKHADLSLFFSRGELGFIDHSKLSTALLPNSFLVRHNTTNLVARFYLTKPEAFIRPYILVGAGLIWYESIYTLNNEHFIFSLPTAGAGLNFRLGPIVSLRLQEILLFTVADHVDDVTANNNNDMELFHSAGLTFNLGKQPDTDKDGVSDKKDKCENTPIGISVDATGCPLDKDKDGVADYLDACPDVAGLAGLKGCPDSDMDGITDKDDRCPTTFGPPSLNGCPDADKDGIADIDDKCPGTLTGYKVDGTGCTLDNDKDGIVNEEDKCPEIAGELVFKGCPDSDADGIPDNEDRCPLAKGPMNNKGCPEIAKVDVQKITVIASKIYFETNKADLKLISHSALDDLADILKRNESVNLTIEGHTDSDADDAYNMTLSQKRTESVKDYLISKGVSASRLTPIGYGETKPIATNKTAAGKAKNRRVELKTSY